MREAPHLIGRAVLEESARLLGERSIPVMPLKGIWLGAAVYAEPSQRPITDVDVLVPEPDYAIACAVLQENGFSLRGSNASEAGFISDRYPLPLDLHRRLFSRGAFCMPTEALFARGQRDRTLFGFDIIAPDPLDVFAHLVGHFVKSRGGRDSLAFRLLDFVALPERYQLDPRLTAQHLVSCGLGRACRYALQCVPPELDRDGFCRATVRALPRDWAGDLAADAMLRLRDRWSERSRASGIVGFVLEPNLPAAVRTIALRMWDRRADFTAEP